MLRLSPSQSREALLTCNQSRAWVPACGRRIEPADSSFNLLAPEKYATGFGGMARIAAYAGKARSEAAAAGQDILVLHAGGCGGRRQVAGGASAKQAELTLCTRGLAGSAATLASGTAHVASQHACTAHAHACKLPPLASRLLRGCFPLCARAGDQYTGTLWDVIYTRAGNVSVVAGMANAIGFDAMVRRPGAAGPARLGTTPRESGVMSLLPACLPWVSARNSVTMLRCTHCTCRLSATTSLTMGLTTWQPSLPPSPRP